MPRERIEHDARGEVRVPADAYWGAETQRAVQNFPVSGQRMPRRFLQALAILKRAAAETNMELGLLDKERGEALVRAAQEVADGKLEDQFPVDVFQTGSGTSTNMNTNEVLANRASEILGKGIGSGYVDAHDHVNIGQSSNDTIPSAVHISAARALHEDLLPVLRDLHASLADKAKSFHDVLKSGRTHLQDAAPIRLGQEFSGWARQVELGVGRLELARDELLELALGGTAVGTGLNAHPEFARRAIARVAQATDLQFHEAPNHFEAQGSMDKAVSASGALKATAVALFKIANDIRWLGSGPNNGIGELRLPAVQPGSSIMPGKVNPVMSESLMMVCCQVVADDAAVALGGLSGSFELNTFLPLMARNILESIDLLAHAARNFDQRCVRGLEADEERCRQTVERNTMLVTALSPLIGHERAAEIALEAVRTGRTVREVAREKQVLPEDELDAALDARKMTEPGAS
ncbi:MAG: class II fumarate hydratase [Candidatus Krumholzibacteriia bacterium]